MSEFDRLPLKRVATLNDQALGDDTDPDRPLLYVDIGNVSSEGQILDLAEYTFEKAPSRARRVVQDGDVIISTVRTYLQAIAPIIDPPDEMIVSTGFAVVRPDPERYSPAFCKYALRDVGFLAEVQRRSTGVSYPATTATQLAQIPVPVPLLDEQRAIAADLDRETARIDALIAAKRELVARLGEKRQTLVARAVTRGLDPGAPTRDSGVPWIGEVPSHWDVDRGRWLFDERDERSAEGDEEMLTVSHLTGVTKRSEKDVNMFEATSTVGYKVVQSGDLAINTLWAWMGAMGTSPHHGIVSPAYHVYEPGPRLLSPYVDAMVRTERFVREVTRYSKGVWSSRLRLYPSEFFDVLFPVPPLDEQRAIAAEIERQSVALDAVARETRRSIDLLKERRAALISATVTGQRRVV